MQYLLIRAPYTRIVVFWHISNIPPMISQSQISCNTPTFYIATIFVKYSSVAVNYRYSRYKIDMKISIDNRYGFSDIDISSF